MSEERAPYYVGNVPQVPPVQRPETWQAITFSDGSTLEVMTRSPNHETLAVQWARVLQRWLDEQLEAEGLFGHTEQVAQQVAPSPPGRWRVEQLAERGRI